MERVIEIIDSIPSAKNYLKDRIQENCGQLLSSMWRYLMTTTLVSLDNENLVFKHKLANQYTLRLILALLKNHPTSQATLYECENGSIIDKLYQLSEAKYKDKSLTILAVDIIESLTNKNH